MGPRLDAWPGWFMVSGCSRCGTEARGLAVGFLPDAATVGDAIGVVTCDECGGLPTAVRLQRGSRRIGLLGPSSL